MKRILFFFLVLSQASWAQMPCLDYSEPEETRYVVSDLDKVNDLSEIRSLHISKLIASLHIQKLSALHSLKYLSVGCESLKKLPEFFLNYSQLENLSFYDLDSLDEKALFILLSKLPRLKELHLSYSKRAFRLPDELGNLQNLEALGLHYVKLPHLNNSIARLSKLRRLELESCELKSLPGTISRLKNLEYVSLAHIKEGEYNYFPHIPPVLLSLPKLKYLNMFGTGLKDLPASLALTKIECLSIGNNPLVPDSDPGRLVDVLNLLAKMPSLRGLDLSMLPISELPPGIARLKNLEYLDLYYTGVKKIPDSIAELSKLKHLDLSYHQLDKDQQARLRTLLPTTKFTGIY